MDERDHKAMNEELNQPSFLGAVPFLNVYEYIWLKVFPNEELNYDDFYDWSRENANIALELALEYCELNGC